MRLMNIQRRISLFGPTHEFLLCLKTSYQCQRFLRQSLGHWEFTLSPVEVSWLHVFFRRGFQPLLDNILPVSLYRRKHKLNQRQTNCSGPWSMSHFTKSCNRLLEHQKYRELRKNAKRLLLCFNRKYEIRSKMMRESYSTWLHASLLFFTGLKDSS